MNKIWLISIAITVLAGAFFLLQQNYWMERILTIMRTPQHGKLWKNEVEKSEHLYSTDSADCFFVGDSHIEQCEWQELFRTWRCANRGIGSETTSGLLQRLNTLPKEGKGRPVFLQTGINDLLNGSQVEPISERYRQIVVELKTKGYIVIPTLVFFVRYLDEPNLKVLFLNREIEKIARQNKCHFINLNHQIASQNRLKREFTSDGIHLNSKGYQLWYGEIKQYLK